MSVMFTILSFLPFLLFIFLSLLSSLLHSLLCYFSFTTCSLLLSHYHPFMSTRCPLLLSCAPQHVIKPFIFFRIRIFSIWYALSLHELSYLGHPTLNQSSSQHYSYIQALKDLTQIYASLISLSHAHVNPCSHSILGETLPHKITLTLLANEAHGILP